MTLICTKGFKAKVCYFILGPATERDPLFWIRPTQLKTSSKSGPWRFNSTSVGLSLQQMFPMPVPSCVHSVFVFRRCPLMLRRRSILSGTSGLDSVLAVNRVDWPGLDWPRLALPQLASPGLAWLRLASPGLAWPGLSWPGLVIRLRLVSGEVLVQRLA